jgi:hypothetical protein
MKDDDNLIERIAQGIPVKVSENERLIIVTPNTTLKQYAAIKLKVPRSGDPELDDWIRESRRADFAGQALTGALRESQAPDRAAQYAYAIADAMLAEWEKGAGKKNHDTEGS